MSHKSYPDFAVKLVSIRREIDVIIERLEKLKNKDEEILSIIEDLKKAKIQ